MAIHESFAIIEAYSKAYIVPEELIVTVEQTVILLLGMSWL